MISRTDAVKTAYARLSAEEKAELALAAKIKRNTFAYIDDAKDRKKVRTSIVNQITSLMDELEVKCGDDTVLFGVPRHDPGVNGKATSRALYPLLKMFEASFAKDFVVFCSQTINQLDSLD
jgi:hypothetical protein